MGNRAAWGHGGDNLGPRPYKAGCQPEQAVGYFWKGCPCVDGAGLPQSWSFTGRAQKELGTLAAVTFLHLTQQRAGAQDGCP